MKKRLLSLVMALVMTFGAASALPQSVFTETASITASADSSEDLLSWKESDILGTWKGSYGSEDNYGNEITREFRLKFYSCSSNGDIKGYAFIDNGLNGFYHFKGIIDFETGAVSFRGDEWFTNPNNRSFTTFSGKMITSSSNELRISGCIDYKNKPFTVNKESDDYRVSISNFDSIPKDWFGEGDGSLGNKPVRRNYSMIINNITHQGSVDGVFYFYPSPQEEITLGGTGSFYFSGHIDITKGIINIKSSDSKWINKPGDNWTLDNFNLIGFFDLANNSIIGSTKHGIWEMSCLGKNKGTKITNNKTIKFSYGNYGEPVRDYSFVYSDDWLTQKATVESADMARFTSNLAVAAYEKQPVTSCLEQMGFDKSSIQTFGSYDFVPTYEDNDRVAFTIAYKQINGKNVFVVPIRGTHGNCEWISNFNLGTGENHKGFYRAANKVKSALANSFSNIGAKPENTVVLFTGHSRGAAVANILAGELCTVGIKSADEKTNYVIPKKQVFGYTYACPAVSSALKPSDTKLTNIYNYINPGDLIPALPLSDWGYTRYGNDQTIVFETNNISYYDFQHRFYDFCKKNYKGTDSVKGIESTLKALVPDTDDYNSDDFQLLFKYVAIQMMENTPESVLPCPTDELFAKLRKEYHISFPLGFNSATETAGELAIYLAPLFRRINPFTLGVAFANLKELLAVAKSDAIAHGHTGETYVKWVEAWYAKSQNISHVYKNPVVIAPRLGSDGYTLHECKKCNYTTRNNYTTFDAEVLNNNVLRIAGSNRFDTSAQIANQCYGYSETVVLASGIDYPDALAGIPLAQAYDAPILLTAKDSISQSVLDEITSLHAKRVIILGGQGAISSKVEEILRNKGLSISRIAGSNRFDTAARVAEALNEKTKTDTVFFAYYNGFADALSVSHVAGIMGAPVLYVTKDGDLDESTKRYLDSVKGNIKNVFVIGGSGVISDNMKMKIGSYTGKIAERVAGKNRYQTCVAINRRFNSFLTGQDIFIATGKAFPDALAGGVLAAKTKSPLILADGVLAKEQEEYIKNHKAEIVCALGGIGAVPQSIIDSIVKLS